MARVLVCGTLAYDDIGSFATPLTAETRNVKLDRLVRGFGGCAMNIAYNLAGLGHTPVPFVYAGNDYSGDYARHVARSGISEAGIFRVSTLPSARGIVLTGSDGAQFTAFYPGPSGADRWSRDLDELRSGGAFEAAVIAPDLPDKMAGCAARLDDIPLRVWCPGQYAELLEAHVLDQVLGHCDLLLVNRHEWQALDRLADAAHIRRRVEQVVITDGPRPVEVDPERPPIPVPALPGNGETDPTGCGDAFAAGLVAALVNGSNLDAAVRQGIGLAGACFLSRGAQDHRVLPRDT